MLRKRAREREREREAGSHYRSVNALSRQNTFQRSERGKKKRSTARVW